MSRWFPSKTKIQKWIEEQEKDFTEALRIRTLILAQKTGWEGISLLIYMRFSLEGFIRSYTSGWPD
jgi:hypothetical protein